MPGGDGSDLQTQLSSPDSHGSGAAAPLGAAGASSDGGGLVAPGSGPAGPGGKGGAGKHLLGFDTDTIKIVAVVVTVLLFVGYAGTMGWINESVRWTLTAAQAAKQARGPQQILTILLLMALEGVTQTFAVMGAGTVLGMGAGFLYGTFWGGIITALGAMFGATLSFYLARGRLKEYVEAKVKEDGMVMQISKAFSTQPTAGGGGGGGGAGTVAKLQPRQTFLMITLSRVPPLFPFALINYAYALTDMDFKTYFVPSLLGVWPCCTMDAYLGTLVEQLADVLTKDDDGGGSAAAGVELTGAELAQFSASVSVTLGGLLAIATVVFRRHPAHTQS
eukprot:SAG22_NODE_3090_length_1949_cov_2.245405_1_plen_334_part_00